MRDLKSLIIKIIVVIVIIVIVAFCSLIILENKDAKTPPINTGDVQDDKNKDITVNDKNNTDKNNINNIDKDKNDDSADKDKEEINSDNTDSSDNMLIGSSNNSQNSVLNKKPTTPITRPSISDTINNGGSTIPNKPSNGGSTTPNKPSNPGGVVVPIPGGNKDNYEEPSAGFTTNGVTNAKVASTKIIPTGDYTKIEYAISTSNDKNSVKSWTTYVKGREISIPNDRGNVYVIVRLTFKKDNTYRYAVSRVFNMIAWVEPNATFTTNGASGVRSASTKINATGDYTKVEYAISTSNNVNNVASWATYVSGKEISITNDSAQKYVIVRLTRRKDNTYKYVISNVFNMLQWVEPNATFTTNGINSAKTASTKINVTGDYTKVEYAISTSNNANSVSSWATYVSGKEISIPNDRGNVYVIVRITRRKDNTFKYVVSNVFNMLQWVEPNATFTTNGINNAKVASTKLNITGDYTKVEYAVSTSNNVNNVTSWSAYSQGAEITITNDSSQKYVIVRITRRKDNTYKYVVSNAFNMIQWEAPNVEFSSDGNGTASSSHTTTLTATGDYAKVEYAISTSNNKDSVASWVVYDTVAKPSIRIVNYSYNNDNGAGKYLYVILKITGKDGNVTYKSSNAFLTIRTEIIDADDVDIKPTIQDDFAGIGADGSPIFKKTAKFSIEFTVQNIDRVSEIKYVCRTDNSSVKNVSGVYDIVANTGKIVIPEFDVTGKTINKVSFDFTIKLKDGTTITKTFSKSTGNS